MSTKAFKDDKIKLIKEKVDKAQVAIVTEYKGLSVEEITNLRRALQKDGGDYMVTKNTLAKIAIKGTKIANSFPLTDLRALGFLEFDLELILFVGLLMYISSLKFIIVFEIYYKLYLIHRSEKG